MVEQLHYDTGCPAIKNIRDPHGREQVCATQAAARACRRLSASSFEQSCSRKAYATRGDHVLGSQILGLWPAIAQAMAQHLPTPAGQPQSAEVLVAVLALVGDAITISTTFDFAAPAGSTSAANDVCDAHHAIFANSSIRCKQPFYWTRALQTPWMRIFFTPMWFL